MNEPLVYRVDEVAELLGCGKSTVYDAIERDELPGVLRLGRRILISKAALHAALGLSPPENGDGPAAGEADAKSQPKGSSHEQPTNAGNGTGRRP